MNIEHLRPSSAVAAGAAEMEEAVAACGAKNAALDRILEDMKAEQAKHDAAANELGGLLAERALQTDVSVIRAFQPRLDELTQAKVLHKSNLESMDIARVRLEQLVEEAESHVRELRESGIQQQVRGLYADAIGREWYARVESAVREHLLPLWLEGMALHAALPTHGLGTWLNESRIHALGTENSPLIDRSEAVLDGQRTVLSEAWLDLPELVARYEFVKQVVAGVQLLDSYVPRKARAVQPPYVRRGVTLRSVNVESRPADGGAAKARPISTSEDLSATRETAQMSEAEYRARHRGPQEIDLVAGRALADPDFAQFR
jgi:hypothetical protein